MPRPFVFVFFALSISTAVAQEKVNYDDHIFPIFQQACLNCHNPDKARGGLDLSSFPATLKGGSGGKIVESGSTTSSLISSVQHTSEPKMPPEGEALPSAQIKLLKSWIEGGLLENKSSSARQPAKPKFETTLRSDPAAKPDGPPPMPEHLLLEPPVVTERPAAIHAIAASPWAPLLAVTGQAQVLLYHTESLELVGIIPFPEGSPASLSFTPDARYLIVGGGVPGKSGVTLTFDITSGERLLTVAKEFDSVLACDIRPGFDLVATGGPSRLLKLWNTETGELVHSVKKHTDWITALDLSADGVLLASGDRNGGVWVWESDTCNEFHTLRGHQAAISATVFRADSNLLATASEDGSVRFWEMNGGSEVRKIDAHPGGVTAFAFGHDGSSITTGRDMKAKLWKPDFAHARDLAKDLPALPTAAALDFQGNRAFVADAQGIIRVFQTSDSKLLREIHSNPPAIATRLQELAAEIAIHEQSKANKNKAATTQLAALRHWSAAAINSRAIRATQEAATKALIAEDEQQHFLESAQATTMQASALNQKRNEVRELALHFEQPLQAVSPEVAAEVAATLAAIHVKIDREADLLREAEKKQLAARARAESSAPAFHRKRAESAQLRAEYLRALE